MNISRLNEIQVELMKIQHELQTVIRVDDSIQKSVNYAQRFIVGGIADARNELQYLIKSIEATGNHCD
ncbi:hypothetical protein pEaSNUABM50_00506 [Erwinia phage pEa_SNUABM_50]|uniref:Uncharacterized protein n=4 Tax=Eneladusvirus BF TaxID=2560751 RepID=A0A7L8ZPK4_9CAUD|nr:hypothetical protein FDH34_gp436 [Serratia phage BF]QOI71464.1 hypothetical protein pEaSNUABM12_00550 [Erwinia phage pEa_SNUABM_12]QOI71959.1 hypothetical protein pEaSNUABM47_00507 [Erwinia phage pEa_SNUABM_47]QOI72499.1 hypothetical protein pEaSNUABM50_00506 [Erwinia phage pEa_SNUABM_50]QXO11629.1 hypothetical protein pEaSNUABM19_00515 [Erwinia phage pEa_SNUABM_19]QXO12177.1 hypothetical protein pEaSNUABM44_00513 [Erwinia phage pEa_SNUABM_44]QXO12733.1 hypothetical protein pEaSNUABM49_005